MNKKTSIQENIEKLETDLRKLTNGKIDNRKVESLDQMSKSLRNRLKMKGLI